MKYNSLRGDFSNTLYMQCGDKLISQVETRGGPYHDATIEFLMEDETIARVSSSGIITALSLGTSRLTARAISQLSDGLPFVVDSQVSLGEGLWNAPQIMWVVFLSGTKGCFSTLQDWVIINVVPLEGIRIYAPLRHVETGTTMPLYAMGADPSQNPLSYASVEPPLIFEWSLSNKRIANLSMMYAKVIRLLSLLTFESFWFFFSL